MLINCKPGCSGKKATTTASLSVENNEVVCDFCGENIEVSSFVKTSMKQRGDIVRKDNRKSFQYDCLTCEKKVETEVVGVKLMGCDCSGDCKFNVSKFTIHAMQKVQSAARKSDDKSEKTGSKVNRGS